MILVDSQCGLNKTGLIYWAIKKLKKINN